MIGDSYMDLGNVGPTIQMDANATYRTYYLAGSAMNYGTGQGNIPYQFDSMAVPANPDIKLVIMDGGGNDILLNNSQCLNIPLAGDTMCHMVVDQSTMRGQQLFMDMAGKGVTQLVYFFYAHPDPSVGANAGDWLDYAYPKVASGICGANAPASGDLTCHGTNMGIEGIFVDIRPEFEGHTTSSSTDYWYQADGIHPNQSGADVIAKKVWAQMQKYCFAQ
jgi:lysophospholipase L1-like esterase